MLSKSSTALLVVAVLMLLALLWVALPRVSSEKQTPPKRPQWPPFTAVFEVNGSDYTYNGVTYEIIETKKIAWNSKSDWKEWTLSSRPVVQRDDGSTYSTAGSWRQFKDRVFTTYHSYLDHEWSHTYTDDNSFVVPHMFVEAFYTDLDLPNRDDGETVLLDVVVCDRECDTSTLRSTGQTVTAGKRFEEMPVVFTDDENHIPL